MAASFETYGVLHGKLVRLTLALMLLACIAQAQQSTKFQVSFPASVHAQPITGRVYVILATSQTREPRLQVGSFESRTQFFGADVSQLAPSQDVTISSGTLGYPLADIAQVPPGDYYAQAVLNIYTEFHRSDGHVIWAHLDQGEGQQFNVSPGNLYSAVEKVHLDPKAPGEVTLTLSKVIKAIPPPADTDWLKHVRIQSKVLSKFWGQPIYLGATVLLPHGYDTTSQPYAVIYDQGHFGDAVPFGFVDSDGNDDVEFGGSAKFSSMWRNGQLPPMIAVTFQHPTPFFDDSYAVNSANNGPYGDAIMQELIPYIESHFRIIAEPFARLLTGGSTGGWESLALQIFHPDFFGGTWTFYPDPVDFSRYQLVNIYEDDNAFDVPGYGPPVPQRPLMRTTEGQVTLTEREMSQLEDVLGSHGRSCQQLEAWEAVYGPVAEDGYPQPVWNKRTGKIDHQVADYMRRYDLRAYLEKNWQRIGPELTGKIHVYVGDMDNYYLNLAVYRMQDFLSTVKNPAADAHFEYGRPMKGHGWQPMTNAELVQMMHDYVKQHGPQYAANRR
ncbi:MAG TPA: alpha/beta hydrolase-fold protein [Terriglobales bacterium]|nr:alpha/beta hydrolase-fold protein [Terriglobales bacterium]